MKNLQTKYKIIYLYIKTFGNLLDIEKITFEWNNWITIDLIFNDVMVTNKDKN